MKTDGGMGKSLFASPHIPATTADAADPAEPGLSTFIQQQLANLADPQLRSELTSLSQERDPELLAAGLFTFGQRREKAEDLELASRVYSALSQALGSEQDAIRGKAQRRLQAICGQAGLGARAEFLLGRLARDSFSPSMLLGMTGAGLVGKLSYAAIFGRLSAGPAGLLTRGLLAKAIAGTGSLLLEAPAFTLVTKGVETALGHASSWAPREFAKEVFDGAIFIGAMKFSHALGH